MKVLKLHKYTKPVRFVDTIEDSETIVEDVLNDPDFKKRGVLNVLSLGNLIAKHTPGLNEQDAVWFLRVFLKILWESLYIGKRVNFTNMFSLCLGIKTKKRYFLHGREIAYSVLRTLPFKDVNFIEKEDVPSHFILKLITRPKFGKLLKAKPLPDAVWDEEKD